MSPTTYLQKFVKELKARKALPKHIELSEIGHVHMASIYDSLRSGIITESIFTGMDLNPDVAVLKGLVEMAERKAFAEGIRSGHASCQTERSDGFAAFPIGLLKDAAAKARKNAFHEAVERYAWASWWDKPEIGHKFTEVIFTNDLGPRALLPELHKLLPLVNVYCITPQIAEAEGAAVVIYFAFLESVGVISGGAAGKTSEIETVEFRAITELVRHGLAVRKMREEKLPPKTFYEKRLSFFAKTEEGTQLARSRLLKPGISPIKLPKLLIDEAVPHALSELVAVHRCYFENQPAFIGGALERLCL